MQSKLSVLGLCPRWPGPTPLTSIPPLGRLCARKWSRGWFLDPQALLVPGPPFLPLPLCQACSSPTVSPTFPGRSAFESPAKQRSLPCLQPPCPRADSLPLRCIFSACLTHQNTADHFTAHFLQFSSTHRCAWCLVPCPTHQRCKVDVSRTNTWDAGDRIPIQTGLNLSSGGTMPLSCSSSPHLPLGVCRDLPTRP